MLKTFIQLNNDLADKHVALAKKAMSIREKLLDDIKELQAEYDAIGQEHPGFTNDDVGI
jgi:hypothetical protein